jgi:hypothetical protein
VLLALADSGAAANVFAEVFGDATVAAVSLTTVTVVVGGALHPTAFAGGVFRQFSAVERQTFNVGVTVRDGVAGARTNESALGVTVATVQRTTRFVGITFGLASTIDGFEGGRVSGRAELHETLALPAGLGGASVGFVVAAVNEGGRVGGEDAVGHHGAHLRHLIGTIGQSRSNHSQNNNQELHFDGAKKTTDELKTNKNYDY